MHSAELQYLTSSAVSIQQFLDAGGLWDTPVAKLAVEMQGMAFVARARVRLVAADGSVRVDTGPAGNQVVALSSLPAPDSAFTEPVTRTVVLTGTVPAVPATKSVLIVRGRAGWGCRLQAGDAAGPDAAG